MSLRINLLHEEQSKIVERKRDPLKIGILALLTIGIILVGIYFVKSMGAAKINGERADLAQQFEKIGPKADTARTNETNSNLLVATASSVEKLINERFYWGPLFTEIVAGTGPEIQITGFEGTARTRENVGLTILGISAGREPRAVAERFRQSMEDRLGKAYGTVSSQFVSLENSDTPIVLGGKSFATANFSISFQITLKPE